MLNERLDAGIAGFVLTVACVLSPPTSGAALYTEAHVERIREQVSAHIDSPYEFVCVDDSPYPGWWAKVSLFDGRFKGRALYLDLDVDVVGGLDELAYYAEPFTAIQDFQHPVRINSSVMSWDAEVAKHIHDNFTPEVMERLHGDQNWIQEQMPCARFPKAWCQSYKLQQLRGGWMPDCRVRVYHGRPKSWELEEE